MFNIKITKASGADTLSVTWLEIKTKSNELSEFSLHM